MKKDISLLMFVFILVSLQAQVAENVNWWNPENSNFSVISGQGWSNELESTYHRLPKRAKEKLRKPVWKLSKHSSGLSIRFWSNAQHIQVKYKVKELIKMPDMPATGVSGLDLYSKSYDGEWLRYWGSYTIDSLSSYTFTIDDQTDAYLTYGREYQLFLPLYAELEKLEIGVSDRSFLKPLPTRKEKPIVVYGSSIVKGAYASRPGMAWTNILERKLERPVINLGFSANGSLEPELINLMAEIDAKVYILDCLPDLGAEGDKVYQRILNAVKDLKTKRPNIPILLTAHAGYANTFINSKSYEAYRELNLLINKAFKKLRSEGFMDVFLLKKEELALQFDSYVDYKHPNDVGMMQYADAYERWLRVLLQENSGDLITTIPVTQSRDISVYKWEERHQQILALNQASAPEICLFGDSILHFWGGEPKATIARGEASWQQVLAPMSVANFGFGWDRIENVLWRVQHDELDGFEAKKIVLLIGTNNLGIANEVEILSGLKNLVDAIKVRQPKSKIVLLGILPRAEKENLIKNLNRKIKRLASEAFIDYKEIGTPLLRADGKINASFFTDGLHPNQEGYYLLAEKMQQVLQSN